ncbi:NUDIX domain-containing protein [Paenibacillus thiaminolyticus]|uniref:NUDIX domain-containing protein n=1 Tax=Paenibacillus thiaminolyticus TaxID=49283 RepID=A0AAP9DR87_PANTH|nr:NUDIX domain-containing protein [Paenibacillus thiaminolyticus]MCY9537837.1 NUDIX domain-containing protein [Paenibacillus thiaminolyticus]MCY9605129.1 NUDIX domain-containing protein [Paenibacillus thiaminolyticus]MCY9607184.1 NUDIX domain-containing protein [Paenibacillus thiaminolyticus]MCY9616309.1 NUDIX domain-containing protein [Paenibacillus thiaminolyticus]MCY9620038.1 NUDIX domain-containing protein [Paenibacillus thiaminolyticus]
MAKTKIIVTAGAIIRDRAGRVLLQKRSDYGNWGLPGGGMEPGEAIEDTMIREVYEETGLVVERYELYSIYSGERMHYTYPDGNEVVFVMFLFNAAVNLEGKLEEDGKTLLFRDEAGESAALEFKRLEQIDTAQISTVQRPVFEDLLLKKDVLLRK